MTTTYEFVVELLDFYDGCIEPDIIDCPAFDSLTEAVTYTKSCEDPWRICLRRDTGNDCEGLTERYYAYPDAYGMLPEYMETASGFEDGPKVPMKYRKLIFPIQKR